MEAVRSIDIHAHFFPRAYLELIAAEGEPFGMTCEPDRPGGPVISSEGRRGNVLEARFIDIEARLASMDAQGVDVHALSLTSPMVYWAGDDLAMRLSRAFNDGCAAAHEAHPDRLVGLAMLPMHRPELALEELDRAAKLPGMRGVYMATRIDGMELSDPSLLPVFKRIEALGLPVFLHPNSVLEPARLARFYLRNLIGNPTESAVAASHLIFGEVLDNCPDLVVCLPHGGGSFPYLIGRIQHGWGVRPECKHLLKGPIDYLRRFWYDTVTHSAPALSYLIDQVGADRVMLGSDFCFDMGYERPVEAVTRHGGIAEADQARILGCNAAALLGL
jgi:aminocarboxymuconate-semialdehyde decarboxylase